MARITTTLALAGLSLSLALPLPGALARARAQDELPAGVLGRAGCVLPPTGAPGEAWTLRWDDSLAEGLDAGGKACRVALDTIDGVVTGQFDGPVLGTLRHAVFTGELVGGGALLLLQQREPGYVCSYQLSSSGPGWSGTWRDSRGGCGTVSLSRPEPARITTTAPDIPL